MKNFKIKNSNEISEGPKAARANKASINFMIFILIFVENCLSNVDIVNFSVSLRTDSNPADIN